MNWIEKLLPNIARWSDVQVGFIIDLGFRLQRDSKSKIERIVLARGGSTVSLNIDDWTALFEASRAFSTSGPPIGFRFNEASGFFECYCGENIFIISTDEILILDRYLRNASSGVR